MDRLTTAPVTLRQATPADSDALGRLATQLVRAHHDFDPLRFIPASPETPRHYARFLVRQLEEPDAVLLVAERNGAVVGYAYAGLEDYDYMALRGPAGALYDIVVDQAHRGLGIGRLLLDRVLAALAGRGAPRVVLSTAERNASAQRLFASAGFRRTMIEMTRELIPEHTSMHEHSHTHSAAAADSAADLPEFVDQHYAAYTAEDHEVWRILFERRMATLRDTGSRVFLEGMQRIGLAAERVPDLADVNRRLAARTGWAAVGVRGFIPAAQFFRCLAARRFPTTLAVRPRAQLDYLPEPDIFHDVFGHVPLHSDPVFADFLQRFGALAAEADTEEETTRMARLFWFTVEFGLIREDGRVKIYGSGLISSHGDAANALGDDCDRRPFELDAVLAQPFEIDHFQEVLFVVESFQQLFDAVETIRRRRAGA